MRIFSYWSGPICWLERLSIESAKATGHDLTIFSYDPGNLRDVGLGVTIQDAREIFADPSLDTVRGKMPDHFVDHFRLEGLAKEAGIWIDLDDVFLKTLPATPHLFAWDGEYVGLGVLQIPKDSAALTEYLAICRKRPLSDLPPWWSSRKRLSYRLNAASKKLRGKEVRPPYGLALPYGPPAFTHIVFKHGLQHLVAPDAIFYPVPWNKLARLVAEDGGDDFVGADTKVVHVRRSFLVETNQLRSPPASSWLGQKCREFSISG
jgi:hypothetical protein